MGNFKLLKTRLPASWWNDYEWSLRRSKKPAKVSTSIKKLRSSACHSSWLASLRPMVVTSTTSSSDLACTSNTHSLAMSLRLTLSTRLLHCTWTNILMILSISLLQTGSAQISLQMRLGKEKNAANMRIGSSCTIWTLFGSIPQLAFRVPTLEKLTHLMMVNTTKSTHGKLVTKISPSQIASSGLMKICTATSGDHSSRLLKIAMLIARLKVLSWLLSLVSWASSTFWSVWMLFSCSSAPGDTDGESALSTSLECSACSNSVYLSQLVPSCSPSTMESARNPWELPRFGMRHSSGQWLMTSIWHSLSGLPLSSQCLALFAAATSRSAQWRTCERAANLASQ